MRGIVLIPDWKRAWKFASIQISSLGVLIMGFLELVNQAWISLPPSVVSQFPHAQTIALTLFGLGIVGRLFKLKDKDDDAE